MQDYLNRELNSHLHTLPALLPNVPPCFYDLALLELQRRKAVEKRMREARGGRRTGRAAQEGGGRGVGEARAGEQEVGDGGETWEDDLGDVHDVHGGEEDEGGEDFAGAAGGDGLDWEDVNPHLGGEVRLPFYFV